MLLNFESCTRAQGKYVFKALFDYKEVWKDRQVTGIYLMDDSTAYSGGYPFSISGDIRSLPS